MKIQLIRILAFIVAIWIFGTASAVRVESTEQNSNSVQTTLGTTFSYQGKLYQQDGAVNGPCDLRFSLFDNSTGGNQLSDAIFKPAVQITDGIFVVQLDFGAVFNGDPRWLESAVRCPSGSGLYTILSPRQSISPSPYAIMAERVAKVEGSQGTFTANGYLISSHYQPNDNSTGTLQLHNPATNNRWHITMESSDHSLSFGFLENNATWSHAASLYRNGNFLVVGNLYVNGQITSDVNSTGVLRSVRGLAEDTSAGTLELGNAITNNKWHVTTNRDLDDLEVWFGENNQNWTHPATLNREGDFWLDGKLHLSGNSLVFLNMNQPNSLQWSDTGAALGRASINGEFSANAQQGDLILRAANQSRIILGQGSSTQNYPAALTVEPSGLVNIPNLQGGGYVEANLQTREEREAIQLDRFEQGDVLCWNNQAEQMQKCTETASPLVVAVANNNGKPLIMGVEPVKVLGPIQPGDLLIASSVPGRAVAWSQIAESAPPPGIIIAKALSAFTGKEGTVKAMILPH